MIKWSFLKIRLNHLDAKLNPDSKHRDNNNWFLINSEFISETFDLKFEVYLKDTSTALSVTVQINFE